MSSTLLEIGGHQQRPDNAVPGVIVYRDVGNNAVVKQAYNDADADALRNEMRFLHALRAAISNLSLRSRTTLHVLTPIEPVEPSIEICFLRFLSEVIAYLASSCLTSSFWIFEYVWCLPYPPPGQVLQHLSQASREVVLLFQNGQVVHCTGLTL